MHSDGKSKSREGCFMTKYKWKIKLLKAQMKLQEEMLSFEPWMYYISKWNYLIWWIKNNVDTTDRGWLSDVVAVLFLLENVWISDLQVYQQIAAGTVDVTAVTLEISGIIRYYSLLSGPICKYLKCGVVGAIQHIEVKKIRRRLIWF